MTENRRQKTENRRKNSSFIISSVVCLLCSVFCPLCSSFAAEPKIAWTRTFGGSGDDRAYSVEVTKDGGFILAGETRSFGAGGRDVYLVKTDSKGNEEWSRTFGDKKDDWAMSVHQTRDGGYIALGTTAVVGREDNDVYLIKIDAKGNKEWSRTYGSLKNDAGYDLQQTPDDGYIILAATMAGNPGSEDIYLIKTDAKGNEKWSRIWGGKNRDKGRSIKLTSDGGYIIAGYTDSFGNGAYDVYVVKTDAAGKEIWARTFGGGQGDNGVSICRTSDGGYIVGAYTASFGAGRSDIYLIKIDGAGNEVWSRTFGGKRIEEAGSVLETRDGGYVVAGLTESFGSGEESIYIVKTDSKGNMEWSKVVSGKRRMAATSIWQTTDGGYIVAGYTTSSSVGMSDIVLDKLDDIE